MQRNIGQNIGNGVQSGRRLMNELGQATTSLLHGDSEESGRHVDLLKRVEQKDDFHAKRIRCVTHPERAMETLAPFAELQLTIVCAQNLVPRESWVGSALTDPFVGVFVDDVKMDGPADRTFVVHGTPNPLWQHTMKVGILSTMSMLRLQVYDDQISKKEETGFVEFCVGDIPYDTEISGWLELRYQGCLKSYSNARYASHCAVREDELLNDSKLAEAAAESSGITATGTEAKVKGKVQRTVTLEELKARKHVGDRILKKTRTLVHGCTHSCSKPSGSGRASEADRGNAGEIFVIMKLVKKVSSSDATFALALDPPTPVSYGDYEAPEDPEAGIRKSLDLQKCMDEYADVKLRLWDDFLMCIFYYIRYLGSWRNPWISLPLALLFFMVAFHAYYLTWIIPLTLAFVLILNTSESLRRNMSRGGQNAVLNNDGFKRVARWRSSEEMAAFLKRIIEDNLHGVVTDKAKLRELAGNCFRDGVPTVTMDELKTILKKKTDIITFDKSVDDNLKEGDKVLVDDRLRATVMSAPASKRVRIVYDDDATTHTQPDNLLGSSTDPSVTRMVNSNQMSTTGAAGSTVPKKGVVVEVWRVRKRPGLGGYYPSWLVPTKLLNVIATLVQQFEHLERTSLFPIIELLTDIFTWKKKGVAAGIVLVCLLWGLLAVFIELMYAADVKEGTLCGKADADWEISETIAWVIVSAMRHINNAIGFLIVFAVFILNASWFQSIKSMAKIFFRIGSDKMRNAPGSWAFFRQDEHFRRNLASLPPVGRRFGDNVTAVGREISGKVAGDFKALQNHLGSIRGLQHFKTPDVDHPANLPEDEQAAK